MSMETMITERRLFWLAIMALLAGLVYALQDILAPFVLCAVIAYMFDPLVDRLEKTGLGRGVSTTIVFVVCILALTLVLLLLVPLLVGQVLDLARALPGILMATQQGIEQFLSEPAPWVDDLLSFVGIEDPQAIQTDVMAILREQLNQYGSSLFADTTNMLRVVATRAGEVGNGVSMMVLIPIILFYFLRDWDRMRVAVINLLPKSSVSAVLTLGYRCSFVIGGFFRGQLLVMLLLGSIYGLGLTLIDLPYGFTVGLVAGLISFVPYIGTIVGLTISLLLSVVHFGNWWHPVLVLGVFVFGQTLESVFLTPKLIGDSINLHPVWLIFGLLAGGSLFGFVGLLFAIPITAIIAVVVRFGIEQYQTSHFFDDT